jgi:adenylyltransferase/sulfurtransferase
MDLRRYARQMVFSKIGEEGQRKLLASRAAVLGLGALGSVIAEELCRAGVGFLRLVDRDIVDLTNLQRQTLYTEEDAREQIPKAAAAYEHLSRVNSEITLEPIIADINSSNIEKYIEGMDLILDGSDNFELRFLLNEACHKHRIPWIYGGAIAASGSVMTIIPGGEGPCFRCLSPDVPPPGSYPTCGTAGVLSMTTAVTASFEALEAVKLLTGAAPLKRYLSIDLWENSFDHIMLRRDPECPVCARAQYEFLSRPAGSSVSSLCGQDAFQVAPASAAEIDLAAFAEKLEKTGKVKRGPYLLSFEDGRVSFNLLRDGRAIIKHVKDEKAARSVYAEYIGL